MANEEKKNHYTSFVMHYRIRFDVWRLSKEFLEALHNKWGDLPKIYFTHHKFREWWEISYSTRFKGLGGGGGTPTYKLYHPLVNTKVVCLSWLVIFQVQLLIYFLQLLSLYRKGILDALIVESKAKCSWTLLKLLQINLLFKTLQNYILNQFKTTGCTHTSVCVADCYFIVNVPDLPFVSPIVKDH